MLNEIYVSLELTDIKHSMSQWCGNYCYSISIRPFKLILKVNKEENIMHPNELHTVKMRQMY